MAMSSYNRHQPLYPLSERGYRQAQRNNSHQIWSLVSWEDSITYPNKSIDKTMATTLAETLPLPTTHHPIEIDLNSKDKTVSAQKQTENKNQQKAQVKEFTRTRNSKSQAEPAKAVEVKREDTMEASLGELALVRRKSVQKYLKDLKPYTRTLSNSAFSKFYKRACPETYGKNSTKQGGVCYGDFMKTHNIQPHTHDSKPETYQTMTSALNFGKRTKIDPENRWLRIERQLAKDLDSREKANMKAIGEVDLNGQNREVILKGNIRVQGEKHGRFYENTTPTHIKSSKSLGKIATRGTFLDTRPDTQEVDIGIKRSKSSDRPLYFIYKYQEKGQRYDYTRYARDRHGVTCYVDPAFRQNDEALVAFQKRIKPIYAEKCRPQDVNIDHLRIQNHLTSQEKSYPRHYLTPCCQQPYLASKYSRKKSISLAQTTA